MQRHIRLFFSMENMQEMKKTAFMHHMTVARKASNLGNTCRHRGTGASSIVVAPGTRQSERDRNGHALIELCYWVNKLWKRWPQDPAKLSRFPFLVT